MFKGQKITIPIMLLLIIILGFEASSLQRQVEENNSENEQIQQLLTGTNNALGYTCGILNTEKAKTILKTESVNKISGQGPADEIREGEAKLDKIFWNDNCRFVDLSSNAKYVEMYVSTFQNNELAKRVFLDFIPDVNNKVLLPPDNYGQELIYDGGVYYLLQENRVIQIAASNGNPSQIETFSRQVFTDLMNDLAL